MFAPFHQQALSPLEAAGVLRDMLGLPSQLLDSRALRFWERRLRFLAHAYLSKLAKLTRGLHCSFKRIFKCILTHLMCWQHPGSFQEPAPTQGLTTQTVPLELLSLGPWPQPGLSRVPDTEQMPSGLLC